MTAAVLSRAGRMVAVWGLLLAWHWIAPRAGCLVAAALLLVLAASIAASALEAAFQRRHAFASHYLHADGRLYRLLRPATFTLLWQGAKAVVLATVLMVSAPTLETWQWAALLVDALVMALLVGAVAGPLQAEVHAPYVLPLARRWAVRLNAVLLWLALVVGLYYSPQESYSALRWEEVAGFAARQVAVGCEALALLTRLAGVVEALALWAAQSLFSRLADPAQTVVAWLVFLASFGASFLFTWAYSRALGGTQSEPWRVWPAGGAAP